MKRSAALIGLMSLLLVLSAYADVPKTIHYQGRITDLATGDPIVNGVHSVRISLYESQSATATAWSDLYDVQTQSGYFEASLGSNPVAPLNISFDKPYWIGIKVGADSEMSPRQPLSSVPYALQVANGAITTSKLVNGAVTGAKILDGTVSAADVADGTIGTADIADGAITKAKSPWAPVVYINGTQVANPKIASGYCASSGPVSFPLGLFGSPPIVAFATVGGGSGHARVNNLEVANLTKDGFTTHGMQYDGSGFGDYSNITFYWIAIGQ